MEGNNTLKKGSRCMLASDNTICEVVRVLANGYMVRRADDNAVFKACHNDIIPYSCIACGKMIHGEGKYTDEIYDAGPYCSAC